MLKFKFKVLGLAAVVAGAAASADARLVLRRVDDGRSLTIESNKGKTAALDVEAGGENPRRPSSFL